MIAACRAQLAAQYHERGAPILRAAALSVDREIERDYALFAAAFAVGMVGLALLHWSVREPRHDAALWGVDAVGQP